MTRRSASPLRVDVFSGLLVQVGEARPIFTPYQTALIAIVFAEGPLSRKRLARLLWDREIDPHVRHRLRQLIHAVRNRAGRDLFATHGDEVRPAPDVRSDVETLRHRLAEGALLEAAQIVDGGFLGSGELAICDSFSDWRERFENGLRATLLQRAEGAWIARSASRAWADARDAAEASYLLAPNDPEYTARVIEARARVGRLQAAEVAYTEHLHLHGRAGPVGDVEQAISKARRAAQEAAGGPEPEVVPFVGRGSALRELDAVVRDIRGGLCRYALISGEPGIGKTRLLREVSRSVALDGVRALESSPVELERRISLNPILDALSKVDLEAHLTRLGEPWRTVIGATLPPGTLAGPVSEPPPIDDRSLPRRLMDAFSMLLEAVAREQPTILFIDDLHWADATTISTLHFFRRRWARVPFGVIATVRPDAIGERDPLHVWVENESKYPLHRIRLSELEGEESRQLLQHLGEGRLSADAAEKLLALAGAHPLYLTELTRDYLAGRLILPRSQAEAFSIPVSLRQILSARWSQCSPEATRVAQLLAVASRPKRVGVLSRTLKRPVDEVIDAVEELRDRRLCASDRDRVWISHDLFKTAIYTDLGDVRTALLHRQMAEELALTGGPESAGELAIHYDRAGERKLAAESGWHAGERAMMQGAVAEAAHFFELVARNEHDGPVKAQATAQYATAFHLGRDMKRANPALELASMRLRAAGLTSDARRTDIRRVEGLGEAGSTPVDELIARLTSIKSEARASNDWEAVALALDCELRFQNSLGHLPGIEQVFDEFREVSEKGSPDASAVCHIGLAMGVLFGDPREAVESARTAVRMTESAPRHRLSALWRYLVVMQFRGRVLDAGLEPLWLEARALAARSGDVRVRFSIESNLASALLDAGQLDRAEEMLNRSTALLGSADMDVNRLIQANNYAELALARSDFWQARAHFEEALTFFRPTTPPQLRETVTAGIGLSALETGDLAEARRRESELGPGEGPWVCDPTTSLTFRVRMLEKRAKRNLALDLLRTTSDAIRGRLDLAWLKVSALRANRLIKWGQTSEGYRVACAGLELADELGLSVLQARLKKLAQRASASGIP